ncbi:sensor histidine kinase [Chryseobacterium jejuense]|uniref:Histidine kinase n=1 Tax=Chryseobacterium jejuense TaxID=445960 RepID=A0A2X2X3T5_CHRJE|nr:sensor histidine kinase [Chryseobacterium jejuense]SDI09026.1 Histidine kinase [Chryseobacterium jejuense]SQB47516.1 Inner membrane protein ypdA [Chryseobacterium jejuense]
MNFINRINLKRTALHCLYWILFLLFFYSNKSDNEDSYAFIVIYSCKILAQAAVAYGLIYWIIPETLNKKRYLLFIISAFGWLYFVFALLMIVKFYYLEPRFPTSFNDWLGHTMTIRERLTSGKLIVREFSFITYPVIILGFISFNRKQQRLLKLEEEKKSIELKVLKNQLNPHFLFNTLNNLYTLTLKKDDKAPEVIAKLSEILDFVLYRCNEDYVSVEKEITLIENYIALEKLRYDENRLDILFTKDIQESNKISPLIVLTFIENAFKHGVINETEKATIRLSLESKKEQIIFSIKNTKPQNELARISNQSKIGLENVRKQLDLLYPKKYQLEIEETQRYYTVKLCLKN